MTFSGPGWILSFLPPAGNNTGRKTIRISRVAAVGTNSESTRYPPKEKGNSPLTGKREERKDQLRAPGPECGRVFKPRARFSRFMGRLAKIFDPNLRIYSLLLLKVALLRYRPSLLLNLAIAFILAGPSRFQFLIEIEILFH